MTDPNDWKQLFTEVPARQPRQECTDTHHAEAASLPAHVRNKTELYARAQEQLLALVDPGDPWVSALANCSSLLYHLYAEFHGKEQRVNWVGAFPLCLSELDAHFVRQAST